MKIEILKFVLIFMFNCVLSDDNDISSYDKPSYDKTSKEFEDFKNQIIYYQDISNLNCNCSYGAEDTNFEEYCKGKSKENVKINYVDLKYTWYGECW